MGRVVTSVEPVTETSQQVDKRFGQAMLLFGIAAVLMLTLGIAVQAISLTIGLAISLLFVLLLPAVLFVRWKGVPIREALRLRPISPALIVMSLLVGVGGWGIAAAFSLLLSQLGLSSLPNPGLSVETPTKLLVMLFVAAVLPGICEECFFRGAIQGVLERRGKWFAIVFAAVLFGLFHMEPIRILAATLLGIFFGWLVVRTGSIFPAMLAHFANNATAFTAGYLLSGNEGAYYWLFPALAVLWLIGMFIFVGLTAKEFQSTVKPSALEHVPAGVSPAVAFGCGIPGVGVGVAVIAGIAAVSMILTSVQVDDDALAPEVKPGDQVILMKPNSPVFDVSPEQVVVFKRDGKTLARKVSRTEGSQVWVTDPTGGEIELNESEIVGSMVQVIPSASSSQQ